MPTRTFYSKGEEWFFTGFSIKGETIYDREGVPIDFFYHELVDIDSFDSGEHADRLESSLHKGMSYPINKSEGRDGSFDDKDIFLVFEKEDLDYIKSLMP